MRQFKQDKGRNKAPQIWEVETKDNKVTLSWGLLGGAMQHTTQAFEGVSVGKTNFKTPAEVAENWAERQGLLRTREGYVECDPKTQKPLGEESASGIDWEKGLPPNLRFFKPQNSLNAHCEKLLRNMSATLLRKRDGMMHVIEIGDGGGMTMYSSKLQRSHKDEPGVPWLERFPHLGHEIANLNLPAHTILLGELCTGLPAKYRDEYGMAIDDFTYVSTITKSLTPLAIHKQKESGHLGFCIWDIAYWEGECVLRTWPSSRRFDTIRRILQHKTSRYITMPETVTFKEDGIHVHSLDTDSDLIMDYVTDDLVKEVLELAKTFGWEGWVVVDGQVPYDDKAVSFHGKADRPKFVCKLKPKSEADFIVRWDPDNGIGARGKGKKSKGVGSVMAYLWDPKTKQEVPICEVGGGLTDEDVAKYANPKLYPMVWAVEFDSWTPKGALRFPVFLRERDDKQPDECLISQRPAAEEGEE